MTWRSQGESCRRTWNLEIGIRLWIFLLTRNVKAQNRIHAKYPSLHGSTPYIATRYKKKNPETQELQGPIDNCHHMHYRPSGGWVNDLARIDHEAMLRDQATQTQEHGSASSSVKEKEIITKVLKYLGNDAVTTEGLDES